MCGISGFNCNNPERIQKMNIAIKHRGPDDEGVFVDALVSLGHVRLSILDLSEKGRQPMAHSDKSAWITYNGEIYNFKQIRTRLESKGHTFSSDTDTEVILNSYQEEGINCVKELNGIFAFCIYDVKQKCLYLVRDRLGIKPLYYYYNKEKFIFSSEVKAFKACDDLKFWADEASILEYYQASSISRESFIKGIEILKPGHYLRLDLTDNSVVIEKYVDVYAGISKEIYATYKKAKEGDVVNELDRLLHTVVKDQLVSDAPLGTICSGGLDSSLITAIARTYKENIKIFNVRVEGVGFDESEYAAMAARHLGLPLIEAYLDQKKYLELYQRCIELEDLPLSHPNSVGIYLISRKAKEERLSVLLSGEGADELFGGYHQYQSYYKHLLCCGIPYASCFLRFRNGYPDDSHHISLLLGKDQNSDVASGNVPSVMNMAHTMGMLQGRMRHVYNRVERNTLSYILKDLQYYLVSILRRTDRMSMGAGIEMRVPYLDNRLVDFTLNLPLKYRLNFAQGKRLLKKVAERYLPKEIIYRRKMGFPLPIEEWLGRVEFKKHMYAQWALLQAKDEK